MHGNDGMTEIDVGFCTKLNPWTIRDTGLNEQEEKEEKEEILRIKSNEGHWFRGKFQKD